MTDDAVRRPANAPHPLLWVHFIVMPDKCSVDCGKAGRPGLPICDLRSLTMGMVVRLINVTLVS